jgi:hypothetical protein
VVDAEASPLSRAAVHDGARVRPTIAKPRLPESHTINQSKTRRLRTGGSVTIAGHHPGLAKCKRNLQ